MLLDPEFGQVIVWFGDTMCVRSAANQLGKMAVVLMQTCALEYLCPALIRQLGWMGNKPVQPDLRTSHPRIGQHEHPASVFQESCLLRWTDGLLLEKHTVSDAGCDTVKKIEIEPALFRRSLGCRES